MAIPLPITKRQLAEIVACYAMMFPDWKLVEGDRLERSSGPIVQQIGFEALRSGAYRPAGVIWVSSLPTVAMLHQFLDVKHRQILLREHASKWGAVVAAMEQQFRPPVRKPLDLYEIRSLCEHAARGSTNDLCMLAILHAYLGENEKALSCCERMQALPPPSLAPRLDWEQRHKEFGQRLRAAIEAGNGRQFLDLAAATAAELA